MMSPLATEEQRETEVLALRLFQHPEVRRAREAMRGQLLADPAAKTPDGWKGLDRALDQWAMALCMRLANDDPMRPKLVWNVDNTPRTWFGHTYLGGAVAVDNPDNINREAPLDGDEAYEVTGRYGERASQFTLMIEVTPKDQVGMGRNVATLTTQQIKTEPDGSFRITIDKGPAQGRVNHMQSESGRMSLFARDSFSDWAQIPTALSVRRVSPGTAPPPASQEHIAGEVARCMKGFVTFWQGFKDTFLGFPEPNQVIGPQGRPGGWGYLAGGRYKIGNDEALILTTTDGGSAYTGLQVTDPWTIAPDPVYRTSSLNKAQSARNPDGSTSYVLSLRDPGVKNWIDLVGLHEGWFLLRWQGVPPTTKPETLVREARLVKLCDVEKILADTPKADLAWRRAQIETRMRDHAARTRDR